MIDTPIELVGEVYVGGSGGIINETDPTVPDHVKAITKEEIDKWNSNNSDVGVTSYNDLLDQPSINDVVLSGNKTLEDLGIEEMTESEIKSILDTYGITDNFVIPTKTSELINDSGFLDSIPEEYITNDKLNDKGYLTSIPSEYITETELNDKGYLTQHQDISNLATMEYVDNLVGSISTTLDDINGEEV